MHVALFTPLDATEPVWLTEGDWEVTKIDGYCAETGTVWVHSPTPAHSPALTCLGTTPPPIPASIDTFTLRLYRPPTVWMASSRMLKS